MSINSALVIIIIICYIYIALLWVLKALYIVGGKSPQHDQCSASTWIIRQQPYCPRTPTTHQLIGGEETEWCRIYGDVWGWLGGHDGQRPMGKFVQDAGVTPLLFFEGHPGIFNDHRESGPRFNISSGGQACIKSAHRILWIFCIVVSELSSFTFPNSVQVLLVNNTLKNKGA